MSGPPSMFDSVAPHEAASLTAAGSFYIQPTLNHGLRIWWAFFWPVTLIAGILTVASNFGMKYMYENMNTPGWALRYPMKYGSYAIEIVVGYFVIYYLLHKNFRHFRIALFPKGFDPDRCFDGDIASPTFGRSSRVWWTFTWRRLVYSVVAYIVVMLPLTWFAAALQSGPSLGRALLFHGWSHCQRICFAVCYLLEYLGRRVRRFRRSTYLPPKPVWNAGHSGGKSRAEPAFGLDIFPASLLVNS